MASQLRVDSVLPSSGSSLGIGTASGTVTLYGNVSTFSSGLNVSGVATISSNSTEDALRITQTGSGNALVVEDTTNPDPTPFVITTSGDVGIKTANPSAELEVRGTADAPTLTWNGSGQTIIGDLTNQLSIGRLNSSPFGLYLQARASDDAARSILLNPSGGNVGIGTDDPASKLHLYSTGPQAQWTDSDNDSDSRIRYNGNLFIFEADSFSEISDSAFSFRVDGTNISDEKLRITNDGNVGIGSTQPRALLDIAGSTTIGSGGRLDVYRLSSTGNNTAFTINSDVGGTNSTKLVVTANGNTGIGSDAPEYPLDIGRYVGGVVARFGPKDTGAVAITLNDGGGNANVTFNHTDEIPGQDGSSGRIHCAVDNTTALIEFELADSVTAGVQPTVTSVFQIRSDSVSSKQEHRFDNGISFDGGTNVLDSYEEGTLTLSVIDNAVGTGNTGSGTFNGYYTKIGNMVQVSIDLTNIDTTGMTSTNIFYIHGLPYNVQNLTATQRFTSAVSHDLITYQGSATNIIAVAQDNTSYIRLQYQNSGASTTWVDCGDLTSGSADIRFNLWYQTGA